MLPVASPWLVTLIAVVAAAAGAVCFAAAAVLQQKAVRHTVQPPPSATADRGRLDLAAFGRLLRRPAWLVGGALLAGGAALHVVALTLAPLAVVQPIGVLAVPVVVLLAARATGDRPGPGVTVGAGLTIVGTLVFVWLASGSPSEPSTVTLPPMLTAAGAVAVVLGLCWLFSSRSGRTVRCIALSCAGAISFGLGSALLRAVSQQLNGDSSTLFAFPTVAMLVVMAVAMVAGGWSVQQAYASGPPDVVISCLTVGDPLTAVILGILLLGEGSQLSPAATLAMVCCALAAAAGVRLLARHHPEPLSGQRPSAEHRPVRRHTVPPPTEPVLRGTNHPTAPLIASERRTE